MTRNLPILLVLCTFFIFFRGKACDNSTITIANQVTNPDGSITYTLNLFVDLGSLDAVFYGFVLKFNSAYNTPTVVIGGTYPTTNPLSNTNLTSGSISGTLVPKTGSGINSIVNDSDWNFYDNQTNVISYESSQLFGATSLSFNCQIQVTVSGCVETILFDASVNSGAPQCEYLVSTGQNCSPCSIAAPTFSSVTQPTCATSTGSFTITNYVGTNTYSSSPPTGISFSSSSVTASPGTYVITASNGSCTNTASVTINAQPAVPASPTFSSVTQPTCTTPTGSFTITNYIGTNTYSSSPPTGISFSSGSVTASPGTYVITASNGSCTNTASVTINAQPAIPASPTFTQIAPICLGGTFNLPSSSLEGINGSWTPDIDNTISTNYTFTPDDGQCATTVMMTVNVGPPITPTFTQWGPFCENDLIIQIILPETSIEGVNGTWDPAMVSTSPAGEIIHTFTPNSGACANTTIMTVINNQQTVSTFNQIPPICEGGAITLPSSSLEGIDGEWSPSINNTETTNYSFLPNDGQCATEATMTIIVNQSIAPQFTQISPICSGGTFTLPTTSNDGYSGIWSPTANYSVTTNYTFTPDAGLCIATSTMTIEVISAITPTFTNPGPICIGEVFTLPAFSNQGISGSWSPSINNTSTTTYTFTPEAGQCAATAPLTVIVNTVPTAIFSPDVNEGCLPLTVNFTNMSSGSALCNWNMGNGVNIEDCGTVSYTFQQAGCYDISLTLTSQAGCSETTTAENLICVTAIPIAEFTASTYFLDEFHTLVNFENTSVGGTNFEWLFGDSSAISTDENPSYDYVGNDVGDYLVTLIASSNEGCVDSAFATIIFEERLIYYIPNTFTPDGNEFNQTFQPVFTAGFDAANFEFLIYNRWGELIFETENANEGWDGLIEGGTSIMSAPEGVYTWKVNIKLKNNDNRKVAIGQVNLIR